MSDRFTRNVTVYRRDSIDLVLTFGQALPATWEELQLVFISDAGGRLSKFVKNADVVVKPGNDGTTQYALSFTLGGTDPTGTFKLSEGAIRLRDGFIIRWNPEEGSTNELTMTVQLTPERMVALDAVIENKG